MTEEEARQKSYAEWLAQNPGAVEEGKKSDKRFDTALKVFAALIVIASIAIYIYN